MQRGLFAIMFVAFLATVARAIDGRVFVLVVSLCFLILSLIIVIQEEHKGNRGTVGVWMMVTFASVCGAIFSVLSLVVK
jgi:hypothetical protein